MTNKPIWSIARYCALLVIGNAMFALGFNLFLVPNSLNVGGLSGIAMILQRLLGRGGYTGAPKTVLMTAVKSRQISELKQLVQCIDPNAFMIVQPAHQVLGEGFKRYSDDI